MKCIICVYYFFECSIREPYCVLHLQKIANVKPGVICLVDVLFCVQLCCDLFDSPSALFTATPPPSQHFVFQMKTPDGCVIRSFCCFEASSQCEIFV